MKLFYKETRLNLHLNDIAWNFNSDQQSVTANSTKKVITSSRVAVILIIQVCILIAFFGLDSLLNYFMHHLYMERYSLIVITRILFDEVSHAVLSGFVWLLSSVYSYEIYTTHNGILNIFRNIFYCLHKEVLVSMIISNIIDIDHIIQAKTFSIFAATHLTNHPFAHTLLCCFIVTSIVFLISKNIRYTLIVFTSYITHLLRDSIRRGIWVGTEVVSSLTSIQIPSVLTPILPIWLVLVLYCFVIPILIRFFLVVCGHKSNSYSSITVRGIHNV